MPTYEYRCRICGHTFDIVQAMRDESLSVCPVCGGELRKVFAPPAISFKGSGFYATDHGKKSKTHGDKTDEKPSEKPSEKPAASTGPSDGKSEKKDKKESSKPAEKTPASSSVASGSGGSGSGSSGSSSEGRKRS